VTMKRSSSSSVAAANKRGREAGVRANQDAIQRGASVVNHGAGTMPVDAPAPYGGTRYFFLEDPEDAAPPWRVAMHDGSKNAKGELRFEDAPDFRPTLTPAECISRGIFGGCYFNPRGGKEGIFGREVAIDVCEFPASWFANLPESMYKSRKYHLPTNAYGVKSGFGQREWEAKGWMHAQDPRCVPSVLALKALRFSRHDSIRIIPADGFNGIAASSAAGARTTTSAKSSGGAHAPRHEAAGATSYVGRSPVVPLRMWPMCQSRQSFDRRCCTGRMS